MSKCTATGTRRGKKLQREPTHCGYSSQIATLKANNTQLATALDELRQDYRKLQQDNLQLKRERQGLLEKVARLEKRLSQRASKMSASEYLQEAQCKLREVQTALEFVQKITQTSLDNKQHSPGLKSQSSPRKVLRFSTPSQSEGCTIYPRTPYLLHNMTCVVDGPQLASTPVETELSSSSSLSVHLSPHKIDYSDTAEDTSITQSGGSSSTKRKSDDQLGKSKEMLQQQKKESPTSLDSFSTLNQLENALTCDRMTVNVFRPRRQCTTLSLSYQEPTLNRKLRRGDPFTEQMTDWNPPDQRERRKKLAKKSTAIEMRRALQDVKNQR